MSAGIFIVKKFALAQIWLLTCPDFDHTVSDQTLDGGTPWNEATLYMNGLKWSM